MGAETFVTVLLTAVGLSMDAFAVAVTNGMCWQGLKKRHALAVAGVFGAFQGLMPVIGYFAGRLLAGYLEAADHWIAFALLTFVGGKMIFDAVREMRKGGEPVPRRFSVKELFVQGVATSIDALAVGISFAMMSVNIWASAGIIAGVTALLSLLGVLIGVKFGKRLNGKAEIAGGIILIAIGVKIVLEHMLGW